MICQFLLERFDDLNTTLGGRFATALSCCVKNSMRQHAIQEIEMAHLQSTSGIDLQVRMGGHPDAVQAGARASVIGACSNAADNR